MFLAPALLLACAVPAWAAPVTISGSLVVRWQSNPQTCAEQGLCGRSGVLAWRPESEFGDVSVLGGGYGFLSVFGAAAVVRSYRQAGDSVASCIDRVSAPSDIVADPDRATRGLVFSMRSVDTLDSGRCAGPRGTDFAAVLPQSPPVSAAAVKRGGALIDLRARSVFSSGPFSGQVESTLTIRTRAEPRESGTSTHSSVPGGRRGRRVRYGEVLATYSVASLTGDAGYGLSGAPAGECGPFDTCGLTGDVMVHPNVHEGAVTVSSVRAIAGGANETVATGLRAMRAGGTRVFGDGRLGPPDSGADPETPFSIPLTASATPTGGEACTDTGSFREPYLDVRRTRAGVALRLVHGGNSDPDPLRTRCPGPGSDDVGTLATGVIPLAQIGRPEITLALRPSPGFTTLGLRGAGRGELMLTLKRVALRARARTRRVVPEGLF